MIDSLRNDLIVISRMLDDTAETATPDMQETLNANSEGMVVRSLLKQCAFYDFFIRFSILLHT